MLDRTSSYNPTTGTVWANPNNVDLLTRLWIAGKSCSDIGNALGVSRNTIIGKAHRLKLHLQYPRPRPEGEVRVRRTRSPDEISRFRAARIRKAAAQRAQRLGGLIATEPFSEPSPVLEPMQCVPCSLLELDDTRCKWPIGDPGAPDFHFCGAAKPGNGKPYCEFHYGRACSTPKPKSEGWRSVPFLQKGWNPQ